MEKAGFESRTLGTKRSATTTVLHALWSLGEQTCCSWGVDPGASQQLLLEAEVMVGHERYFGGANTVSEAELLESANKRGM